jgi:selenocysteine lyase/cysteine desulfurase
VVSPFLPDDAKLRALRGALPAVGAGIYLNTAVAGPLPSEAAAAMAEIADHELRFGRAHQADIDDAAGRRDEARAALAAVVAGEVRSVALTRGSQDAIAVALRGVDWTAGDALLTVVDAGPDIATAAAGLTERLGVRVVAIDPVGDSPAGRLAEAAADVRVRLAALPHVTATGRLLPVAEIAGALAGARPGLPIVVDGRLAVGALPVLVDQLGVDAYAIAGDAWLLGPPATGGLWLREPVGGPLRPDLAGPDSLDGPVRAADARRFEPGELPDVAVVGLARSAGWLSMFVGLDWVTGRPPVLAAGLLERLGAIPGVRVLTPVARAQHAGIVAFGIDGWPAQEALDELGRRVFAIASTIDTSAGEAIRLSVASFNEQGELDRLCSTIELLAAHTPETLPRRTALTILSG